MRRIVAVVLLFALTSVFAHAKEPADHARLAAIYAEDQAARQSGDIDWAVVSAQDRAHRAEVLELMQRGALRTAQDYFHASMVFQHGEAVEDIRLAFGLAQIAVALDPTNKHARWMTAASWDRILMHKKKPQWYGTQYHKPNPDAPMALYEVDETAVTDEERAALGVPSLQQSKDRAREMGG